MAEGHVFNGFQVLRLFFYSQIYPLFSVLPLFYLFWVVLVRWLLELDPPEERVYSSR